MASLPAHFLKRGVKMAVNFTEHAIDRFVERRMPGASRKDALKKMRELFESSAPLKEKSQFGDTQMLSDGIIFVIKHDGNNGADCATVLFDQRADDTNPLAREMREHEREPLVVVPAPSHRRRRSRRASRWQ